MQFLDSEEIFPTGLLGKIALGISIGIHERIELFAESPNVLLGGESLRRAFLARIVVSKHFLRE